MSNQTPTSLEKFFQLVVQNPSGTALPQRPIIQFTGGTPTDDPVNNRTIVPLGGGGGGVLTAYGADLANSAATLQYVSGISFDSTGLAGAGGAVAVRGSATSLNWLNNSITLARGGTTLLSLGQLVGDFIKAGTGTVASTGLLRGPNDVVMVAARATTGFDIPLLGTDASNNVLIGPWFGGQQGNVFVAVAGHFTLYNTGSGGQPYFDVTYSAGATTVAGFTPTTDVVPGNFNILAPSALAGAATNRTGGSIVFTSGTGATSNGTPGNLVFTTPAPTGSGAFGAVQFNLGGTSTTGITWGTNPTAHGVTCAWGPGVTPGSANYGLYLNGSTEVLISASTDVGIVVNGSTIFSCFSGNASFYFGTGYNTGGGTGVIGISNASVVPTSNPSGGGILYERPTASGFGGTLTHRGLGGSIQEVVAPGTGTINTQLATQRKITAYFRTVNSTLVTAYTYTMPAGTGNTAMLDVIAVGKDVTNAGNITMHRVIRPYWNNAGTATAVGAQTTVYNGGAGGGVLGLGTGSGLTIPIQLSGQGQTEDWEISITAYEN